jgi:hypothetical protein
MTSARYLPSSATPYGNERQPHNIPARTEFSELAAPSTGGKAKVYQVRQVREEFQKLNLKP